MWGSIIEAIVPFLVGFDLYWVSSNNEFHKIEELNYEELNFELIDHLAIALSDSSVAPYESEQPVRALERKLSSVQNADIFPQINRTGPFYGWYLQVQKHEK